MTRPVRPQFDSATLFDILEKTKADSAVAESVSIETPSVPQRGSPAADVAAGPRSSPAADARREPNFLLAPFEKRALPWLAKRLPAHVLPDHLTLLGIFAAAGIAASYLLSNDDAVWLWAVNALLVVHWFGDSLDGTLARVRRIERPRYGYYLDHLTDAFSTVMIGLGLGLSPYMLLSVGLAVVIAYLLLSINVYLETQVFGVFRLGYGWVGPTEARVLLFVVNAFWAAGAGLDFHIREIGMTLLDVVGILAATTMTALVVGRVVANLRELAHAEPPGRVRP